MDDSISPPMKQGKENAGDLLTFSKKKKKLIDKQIPFALSTKNIQEQIKVPNVIGKSLKTAIRILSNAGLKVKVNGSGKVIDQFPKPGKSNNNSKLCILTLE